MEDLTLEEKIKIRDSMPFEDKLELMKRLYDKSGFYFL